MAWILLGKNRVEGSCGCQEGVDSLEIDMAWQELYQYILVTLARLFAVPNLHPILGASAMPSLKSLVVTAVTVLAIVALANRIPFTRNLINPTSA